MADRVRYVNAIGEQMDLRSAKALSNYRSARLFKYAVNGGHLSDEEKEFDAVIVVTSREDADALVNLFESDSARDRYGRFYINNWFLRVKPTGLISIDAELSDLVKVNYSFFAPSPLFMREKIIPVEQEAQEEYEYLDFEYDFDLDYGSDPVAVASVNNTEIVPADFLITASGAFSSFHFSIGMNVYDVDAAIAANEKLVIDSVNKTVQKIEENGNVVDLLGATSDEHDIFEKIPSGVSSVSWNGNFEISLHLFEQRRVPTWS